MFDAAKLQKVLQYANIFAIFFSCDIFCYWVLFCSKKSEP